MLMDGGCYCKYPVPRGCLEVLIEEELWIVDNSCPICGVLKGEKVKGVLCRDCGPNTDLKNEFDWYKMITRMKLDQRVFIVVYWLLIFFTAIMGGNVYVSLFLVSVWYYNVWNYRRYDYNQSISDSKEKMFLIKLRGGNE